MVADYEPDDDRVMDSAERRQRDRTDHVERVLDRAEEVLRDHKYPVTSEELATEYADQPLDLPNETESMGSVFDRVVDEEFESAEQAREAMYGAITGPAGTDAEFNDQRDLEGLDDSSPEDVSGGDGTDR